VGDWTDVAPLGPEAGRLLVVGIGVAVLGLVADLWSLPPAVQVAVVSGGAALTVPYDELGLPAGLLAVAWVVFVTHAFASLDHADGVMGTVGVVTAFALSGGAAAEVMDGLAALLSVLAAALTGFLMQGWPPARIVAGRCGALFAGFVLASAGVLVHAGREPGASAAALFSLAAVAVADLALVARRRGGHLAHRLRRLGLTGRGVVVVIGVAAFGCALVGLLVDLGWVGGGAAWWVAGGVGLVVVGGRARRVSRPRRPYPPPLSASLERGDPHRHLGLRPQTPVSR
jgi:UDP-GlcNAc:undecaprenyl-phosphate GlcNAc-1-phosphate transferase